MSEGRKALSPGGSLVCLLLAFCLSLLAPIPAGAATITADTTHDELNGDGDCSLREAVEAANTNAPVSGCESGDPGEDAISLEGSESGGLPITYRLSLGQEGEDANAEGDLDVSESVTVAGTTFEGQLGSAVDADILDRAFDVRDGPLPVDLILKDLEVVNGNAEAADGGAIRSVEPDSAVTLTDVLLRQNGADLDGGAIYSAGAVNLQGGTHLFGNQAGSDGGGVFAEGLVTGSGPPGAGPDFAIQAVPGFESNSAGRFGGAVVGFDSLDFADQMFIDNIARRGGAISNRGGAELTLTRTVLAGNTAKDAVQGPISGFFEDSQGGAVFSNGDVDVNESRVGESLPEGGGIGIPNGNTGGGILLTEGTGLSVDDTSFTANKGSAIWTEGDADITGAVFERNESFQGPAIHTDGGAISIAGTTFDENVGFYSGGAVQHESGTLAITGSAFTDNRLTDDHHGFGGAIEANAGELAVDGTTFRRNVAQTSGGAIDEFGHLDQLTIMNSTFDRNRVVFDQGDTDTGSGGAVFLGYGSPMDILNSTFTGNRASIGGAIGIFDGGPATLSHSTVVGNRTFPLFKPPHGAGIFVFFGSQLDVESSIVAFNGVEPGRPSIAGVVSPRAHADNCQGDGVVSTGHNIESQDTCGFSGPGDLVNTNPLVAPLADNGGPTETMGLYAGSPAFDAIPPADCPPPAEDQRGVTRTPPCDIGAFEGTVPGPTAKCKGHTVTIEGTDFKDVLIGTPEGDVIAGFAGNDILKGAGGPDLICGGKGRDRLFGGPNRDKFSGGPGRDRVRQ